MKDKYKEERDYLRLMHNQLYIRLKKWIEFIAIKNGYSKS